MQIFKKLWADEAGAVYSSEMAFVGAILVIGLVPGWATLRDAILTEFADMAAATSQLFPSAPNDLEIDQVNGKPEGGENSVQTAADIFP